MAGRREPSYIWRTEVLTVRDSDRYSVVGAGSITVLTPAHGEGRRNKHQLVRPGQRTSLGSANTMRNTLLSSSNTTDLWSQIKPTNSGCILVFAESNLPYFFSTNGNTIWEDWERLWTSSVLFWENVQLGVQDISMFILDNGEWSNQLGAFSCRNILILWRK